MDARATLRAVTLELRRILEGAYDSQGRWEGGDLERRLGELGVWRQREPRPADEISYRLPEDRAARPVVDAWLAARVDGGVSRDDAVAAFVRESAYTWANRLLALRCMEARDLIDDVVLQKPAYHGRSLQHHRLVQREPERCAGEDEGLFAVLLDEFARRAGDLPLLFSLRSPMLALRPSVDAVKRCVALLSGTVAPRGQEAATDEVFAAPEALGWAYMYWNRDEKDRVFENVRMRRGTKIEGADIVPATCIYTERYMVRFLVQNALGATWISMRPSSRLVEAWEYYVPGASRAQSVRKPVRDLTFLDLACGSGHFLLEAFDLFYAMYLEEGSITDPSEVCASILERNLYGIDIDERAVQIAALALYLKARAKAPGFTPRRVNLVATNIRLPAASERIDAFLAKHPEDVALRPALSVIFTGLAHVDELGSLLQVEQPVDAALRAIKAGQDAASPSGEQATLWAALTLQEQTALPLGVGDFDAWKLRTLERLAEHFATEAKASDLGTAFFGEAASRGLTLVDLLARRYDVVAANPPYMGSKNMGPVVKGHVERHFEAGKRDLYAAFILRCLELVAPGGRVAMVTQQSWMFLGSYVRLRALSEDERREDPLAFGGVLRDTTMEVLAHLGEHAFTDSSAAGAFAVLFVLSLTPPAEDHRFTAFRLIGPKSAEEKDRLLREAIGALAGAEIAAS